MTPTQVAEALKYCADAKIPALITGGPGIGKSVLARDVGHEWLREKGANPATGYYDVRLTLVDDVDVRGLPLVKDGRTEWAAPVFWPREGPAIIMLDEITAAKPSVQIAAYQLLTENRVGEYVLPDDVLVWAAGNREKDGASVRRMLTPLQSRFNQLEMDVSPADWYDWANSHDIDPAIIAYCRYHPDHLYDFDPKRSGPYACPRTWEYVSRMIQAGALDGNKETATLMIGGLVSQGVALTFCAFVHMANSLPDLQAIIADPEGAMVPDRMDAQYAVASALAAICDTENAEAIMTYANRLGAEMSALLIFDARRRNPEICNTGAFIRWAVEHHEMQV